jgi:acyl carrier protein
VKLDALIRETLRLPPDAPIDDRLGPGQVEGWDSLGHVNLMLALQASYGITIELDEVMNLETVADIRKLLTAKGVTEF